MCLSVHAHSQVVVEQRLDSMEMFIGEQVHLTLSVTAKSGQRVEFPAVKAGTYLLDGIELLEVADADTVKQDNGMQKISRKYTLTSFDDTLYYLPPVTVKVDGKPYQSKSLALKVITVEDGVRNGGLGSAVTEWFQDHDYDVKVKRLGLPDQFVEHGTVAELQHIVGIDEESIREAIASL